MKSTHKKILGWVCIAPAVLCLVMLLAVPVYNIAVIVGVEIILYSFVIPFILGILVGIGLNLLSKPD